MGVIPLHEFELKHGNVKYQNLNFFFNLDSRWLKQNLQNKINKIYERNAQNILWKYFPKEWPSWASAETLSAQS